MGYQRFGIYVNGSREDIRELTERVAEALRDKGAMPYLLSDQAEEISGIERLTASTFLDTVELVLVIGGDGTFLRAVHLVGKAGIPMLGINKGHLGFLSELEEEEFFEAIDVILSGTLSTAPRMMIAADVYRKDKKIAEAVGLNDLVLNRNREENTMACEVYLGDALIDRYSGDGLIVATPTGSTGYSLSAGGPLIYPGTDCLLVTPICSHFLGSRAVIVPAMEAIDVLITRAEKPVYFVVDGGTQCELLEGDRLHMTRAAAKIDMVHVREHPFFEAVRNKLLDRNYRKW